MNATPDLVAVRQEIDALDAKLRELLHARADLVAKVAASKAQNGGATLRPLREAQQMATLLAWQETHAESLPSAGLLAIWREIIGMALAQQGGLTVYATNASMAVARAHFGASLNYVECDVATAMAAGETAERAIGVIALNEASAPKGAAQVLARLPIIGPASALLYGVPSDMPEAIGADAVKALVQRDVALPDDVIIGASVDGILVETNQPNSDPIWGHYMAVESAL